MPRKPKPITEQLRVAVRKAEAGGMSRGEIARTAGVTVTTVTNLLEGKRPWLDTAEQIASAVNHVLSLQKT